MSERDSSGRPQGRPLLVGVTGGIGAGKGAAVDAFVRRGAVAFSADAAVHRLYGEPEMVDAVRKRWGPGVLDPATGHVDRRAIAEIVFTDEGERRWLESLLHPLVARAWLRFVEEHANAAAPPPLLVAEVPLLFEAGLEERYDTTVLVTAPLELRLQRVGQRARGDSHAQARAAVQMAEEEKARRADVIIVNDGSLEQLEAAIGRLVREMGVA